MTLCDEVQQLCRSRCCIWNAWSLNTWFGQFLRSFWSWSTLPQLLLILIAHLAPLVSHCMAFQTIETFHEGVCTLKFGHMHFPSQYIHLNFARTKLSPFPTTFMYLTSQLLETSSLSIQHEDPPQILCPHFQQLSCILPPSCSKPLHYLSHMRIHPRFHPTRTHSSSLSTVLFWWHPFVLSNRAVLIPDCYKEQFLGGVSNNDGNPWFGIEAVLVWSLRPPGVDSNSYGRHPLKAFLL